MFEKLPPEGPLIIDHVPDVLAVAASVTDSKPHEGGDLSSPANAVKQGLFALLKFTKIGFPMSPPQDELGSIPWVIEVLKLLVDIAPVPAIDPFIEMLELQPELNNVAQSVVRFTLKVKLPNRVSGSAGRGIVPTFQIIELLPES